jgi:hypothetical protein
MVTWMPPSYRQTASREVKMTVAVAVAVAAALSCYCCYCRRCCLAEPAVAAVGEWAYFRQAAQAEVG